MGGMHEIFEPTRIWKSYLFDGDTGAFALKLLSYFFAYQATPEVTGRSPIFKPLGVSRIHKGTKKDFSLRSIDFFDFLRVSCSQLVD